MKHQAFNPYLPSYEYVPDGEPYVIGDRLYVFGSHDAFDGDAFCINDYVCWSAPVEDLSDWKFEGVIYKSVQDPLARGKKTPMNAPDVQQGPDGRYYLYYQMNMQKVMSVAVADQPRGPYEFYGHVKHKDGTLYGKKRGDAYNFDPGLLMDDDGKIYMYTGSSSDSKFFRRMMRMGGGVADWGTVVELEKDMLTLAGPQYRTVPGIEPAEGTPYEGHSFFEASSIRKINGRYYFVYSSHRSHDLCYATSDSPTGPWEYGGILVSIGDIGLPGVADEKKAHNFTGNTHGGMVCIKGQWYIFYHRQTNQQMCARQGCAEPIFIREDGSIAQAEVTSCGLNGGPLKAMGRYEARIACNLWGKQGTFKYTEAHPKKRPEGYPYFTQSGADREENGDQYIANLCDGSVAGFKYFDFTADQLGKISVTVRGEGSGNLEVYTDLAEKPVAVIEIKPEGASPEQWRCAEAALCEIEGVKPLFFRFAGTKQVDFKEFTLEQQD